MEKELLNVFNLINNFKYFQKSKYEISKEDIKIARVYWNIYDIKKYLKFKKFINAVVNYSILKNVPFYRACEDLCKKIKIE